MRISGLGILLIWTAFGGQHALAQDALAQLRQELSSTSSDTARLGLVYRFLYSATGLHPDTTANLADYGLKLAQATEQPLKIGFMRQFQGFAKIDAGAYAEAIPFFLKAHEDYLAIPDSMRAASMWINAGLASYFGVDETQALDYYVRAAAWLDTLGQPNGRLFNNMAIIYRKQEKYDQAIKLYERALAIKKSEGDSAGMAATYMNLGLLKSYVGDTTASIHNNRKAAELYATLNLPGDAASAKVALGSIYLNLRKPAEARKVLEEALVWYNANPEPRYLRAALYDLGDVAMMEEKWEEAVAFYSRALEINREQGGRENLQVITEHLSEALHKTGRDREAWILLRESMNLKDSLTDARRQALTEEMQARFELREQERQMEMQQLELAQAVQKQRLFLILLGVAGLFAGVVLWFLNQRNRSNRLLSRQNKQIEESLAEKEMLMREIHHRVKNNLQFISSLLRLQTRHVEDTGARQALQASQSRVLSMSLIHQHLYQDQKLTGIHIDTYLDRLVKEVIDSSGREVEVETDLEPLLLDVDQAIPLGLMANELLINALKYAHAPDGKTRIKCHLKKKEGLIHFEVSDNGAGLPEDDQKESFGYQLIHLLVEKLNGQLVTRSDGGAQIIFTFPPKPVN